MENPEKEGNERVWKGQAEYTHLAARARKAQLVKVLGGHREEGWGGGGWTELGVASGGFRTVRLSCSRPVGAVPGPPASGLWAHSPVSQSQELLSGLNRWHCQRSPPVKAQASGRHTEGSGFMQANFLRLVHRNSCWYLTASVPASLWHDQISVRWRKNTQWTLIHCFLFSFVTWHQFARQKPHTHIFVIQSLIHQALIAYEFARSIPMMHHYTNRLQGCQSNTLSTSLRLSDMTSHTSDQVLSNMSPLTKICLESLVWKTGNNKNPLPENKTKKHPWLPTMRLVALIKDNY